MSADPDDDDSISELWWLIAAGLFCILAGLALHELSRMPIPPDEPEYQPLTPVNPF